MLYKNSYIRSSVAGLLLVLFAFSVTPRNILHELFANHTDETTLSKKSDAAQLKKLDLLCKCDNLVVESPFIESIIHFECASFQPFSQHPIITSYFFYSPQYFFFEHRGPPFAA
ncbi:MAG TPA: hypothetical protein VK718_08535 [Ferruginibacter sp.]|jgi:hypothetical protein|nr:hypothetical protein [Ferruginibacter sp.]